MKKSTQQGKHKFTLVIGESKDLESYNISEQRYVSLKYIYICFRKMEKSERIDLKILEQHLNDAKNTLANINASRNYDGLTLRLFIQSLQGMSYESSAIKNLIKDTQILDYWCNSAVNKIKSFSIDDLVISLISYDQLYMTPSKAFMEVWYEVVRDNIDSFDPLQLYQCLSSLAKLNIKPPKLIFETFKSAAITLMNNFNTQELSNIICFYNQLCITPTKDFLNSWYNAVKERIKDFSIQEFSKSVNVLINITPTTESIPKSLIENLNIIINSADNISDKNQLSAFYKALNKDQKNLLHPAISKTINSWAHEVRIDHSSNAALAARAESKGEDKALRSALVIPKCKSVRFGSNEIRVFSDDKNFMPLSIASSSSVSADEVEKKSKTKAEAKGEEKSLRSALVMPKRKSVRFGRDQIRIFSYKEFEESTIDKNIASKRPHPEVAVEKCRDSKKHKVHREKKDDKDYMLTSSAASSSNSTSFTVKSITGDHTRRILAETLTEVGVRRFT
jgi:hypothetical protein